LRHLESMAVALAALALYLLFAPPVSGLGDSSEIALVLATNGVAHPTGYPLYTLLGHCFVALLHMLGISWAFAANAWSAVGGAVAVGFLHALGMDLVGATSGTRGAARFVLALLAVVPFALQPVMMDAATTAEINVWSVAWASCAAFVFVRLVGTISTAGRDRSSSLTRATALWGAVCGAGVAHHLTSVLMAGPLSLGLLVALRQQRRLSLRLLLVAGGAALVPLSSYGIIAWRAWHPAVVQWGTLGPGLDKILSHITGSQYRVLLGSFAPAPGNLLGRAIYPLLVPGLALLLWGALRSKGREERIVGWSLFSAAILVAGFTFRYGVPDPEPYFLPPIALGAAAAAPALAALAGARFMNRALRAAGLVVALAATVAIAIPWCREAAGVKREVVDYETLVRSMWATIPSDSAIVFWRDDRAVRLRGYQLLDGEKPALYVVSPDALFADEGRRRFEARFGVDPLRGIEVPRLKPNDPGAEEIGARIVGRLIENVNAGTRLPVIVFDPEVPIVRRLYKPWERTSSHGG